MCLSAFDRDTQLPGGIVPFLPGQSYPSTITTLTGERTYPYRTPGEVRVTYRVKIEKVDAHG